MSQGTTNGVHYRVVMGGTCRGFCCRESSGFEGYKNQSMLDMLMLPIASTFCKDKITFSRQTITIFRPNHNRPQRILFCYPSIADATGVKPLLESIVRTSARESVQRTSHYELFHSKCNSIACEKQVTSCLPAPTPPSLSLSLPPSPHLPRPRPSKDDISS